MPRNRPPYPVTHGYLQQPTVVNNVETFCAAALVALHGDEWYRGIGTAKSAGSKILSVSGDCARPGIYEYPFGVTVEQVLRECGAERAQAVQISGPSGACIDATEFGRRIAFEDLPTAGAFMVFENRATFSRWRATSRRCARAFETSSEPRSKVTARQRTLRGAFLAARSRRIGYFATVARTAQARAVKDIDPLAPVGMRSRMRSRRRDVAVSSSESRKRARAPDRRGRASSNCRNR